MRLTKEAPFLYRKRGIYYFSRRIPADLRGHYRASRVVMSLRTRSLRAAKARSVALAGQLEQDWLSIRWQVNDDPFRRFLINAKDVSAMSSSAPRLSEVRDLYVEAKKHGRAETFTQSVDRAVAKLTQVAGDKPIDLYTRQEANSLRDTMAEQGLSKASIKRLFSVLSASTNFAVRELGLDEIRTFSAIYLGQDQGAEAVKRKTFTDKHRLEIIRECKYIDDEPRWIIAFISDTGMRLSEALGALKTDVVIDAASPHLIVQSHPWRRLKTHSSERKVPLVGNAIWAAKRAYELSDGPFLFPKYSSEQGCKSNSASAALNKWLSVRVPKGCVVHSFRHTLRDRLRSVECPSDIVDRLGGWAVEGVGEGYGDGYPIEVLSKWMNKIS